MIESKHLKGIRLSSEALDGLNHYLELLESWNERMDLVSPAPREKLIGRHFLDSVLAKSLLDKNLKGLPSGAWLDVGSGAGFPGMVFGILGQEMCLLEPREKRSVFLKEVKRRLGLENVEIITGRLEDYEERPPLIISRALSWTEGIEKAISKLLLEGGYAVQMLSGGQEATSSLLKLSAEIPYSLPSSEPSDVAERRLTLFQH